MNIYNITTLSFGKNMLFVKDKDEKVFTIIPRELIFISPVTTSVEEILFTENGGNTWNVNHAVKAEFRLSFRFSAFSRRIELNFRTVPMITMLEFPLKPKTFFGFGAGKHFEQKRKLIERYRMNDYEMLKYSDDYFENIKKAQAMVNGLIAHAKGER